MNRKRWIGLVSAVAFTVAIGWPTSADSVSDQFNGVWKVTVTPDEATTRAGKDEFRDQWLFESTGDFTAEAFGPMGFPPSHFTATSSNGSTSFTVTSDNDSQGTAVWTGTLNGSRISGSLVWTKPDGSVATYTFEGTNPNFQQSQQGAAE